LSAEKFDPFIAEWVSFSKNLNYNLVEKCLQHVFGVHGKNTFVKLIADPPNTKELKDPQLYLNRIK